MPSPRRVYNLLVIPKRSKRGGGGFAGGIRYSIRKMDLLCLFIWKQDEVCCGGDRITFME